MEDLVARLERAVERLEKFEGTSRTGDVKVQGSRVAPVTEEKSQLATGAPAAKGGPASPSVLVDYDALLTQHAAPLVEISKATGSLALEDVSQKFLEVFKVVRSVLAKTSESQEPAEQVLMTPLAAAVQAVHAAAEPPRGLAKSGDPRGNMAAVMNPVRAAAESSHAATWILVSEGKKDPLGRGPRAIVSEAGQAAEFYANKSLMENRGKDERLVAWTRTLMGFVAGLEQYVVKHHPTGLRWTGSQPLTSLASTLAPAAKAGARPPPPPPARAPPPPPSLKDLSSAGNTAAGGGMAMLLAEISKGSAVTSSLKKVTADMKSKNINVGNAAPPPPAPAPKAAETGFRGKTPGQAPQGIPKFELEQGSRWKIEYQVNRKDLEVIPGSAKEVVYVYGCRDCVIQVRGKVNAISLDSCVRVGVVFQDVISQLEAVNSSALQVQCTGVVPTITLDKTDGCQIYITKKLAASPQIQIVTAKCNSINVTVVPESGEADMDEDPAEQPIPEQFITTFDANGKLKTVAAVHSAA